MGPLPFGDVISRHAFREAEARKISVEQLELTYLEHPDASRLSEHDDERDVLTRYFAQEFSAASRSIS